MKVGFDISQTAHGGGVGVYTLNLAQHLSEIPGLEMIYFYSSLRKPFKDGLRNVKSYRLPPTVFELLFNRWRNVSIEKFIGPIDIFHSSDWTQPPTKAKKVTTFHDLIPIKYPNWSHPKIVEVFKRRLKFVEREIDMVIAVSENTKKDLIEVSDIPSEKIKVIYEGPSISGSITLQGDALEAAKRGFRRKYKLPERFVLAIGGIGKRRNLERVKEVCKDYNLVIAGQTLPWLSTQELGLLYACASVLLYPSFYEGFGLAILDAFAAGLPVITSKTSSMPEVGGEAALYVDPFKVEDIKQKLSNLMEDNELRRECIKEGYKRVKKFSWEKAANETYEVYKSLLK